VVAPEWPVSRPERYQNQITNLEVGAVICFPEYSSPFIGVMAWNYYFNNKIHHEA
jgi:hypothetical protein